KAQMQIAIERPGPEGVMQKILINNGDPLNPAAFQKFTSKLQEHIANGARITEVYADEKSLKIMNKTFDEYLKKATKLEIQENLVKTKYDHNLTPGALIPYNREIVVDSSIHEIDNMIKTSASEPRKGFFS